MLIIKNELDDVNSSIHRKCYECKTVKAGRIVQVGSNFIKDGAKRGSYFFCYDCREPMIFWKKNAIGIVFQTPVCREDYERKLHNGEKND